MLTITILGLPNSGKSTLSMGLTENLEVHRFNLGSVLEQEIKTGSAWGIQAQIMSKRNGWIADEMVFSYLKETYLTGSFDNGVTFEGFPGSLRQAKMLSILMDSWFVQQNLVIHIMLSDEICFQRAKQRKVCLQCGDGRKPAKQALDGRHCVQCGGLLSRRADDNTVLFAERIRTYRARLSKVIEYYQQQRDCVFLRLGGHLPAKKILDDTLHTIQNL